VKSNCDTRTENALRSKLQAWTPRPLRHAYSCLRNDARSYAEFVLLRNSGFSPAQRLRLLRSFDKISRKVPCIHTNAQILAFTRAVFSIPAEIEGCIAEAGCFKGGTSAKFSIVAELAKRRLFAFDSFEGMPANPEDHTNIWGSRVRFHEHQYRGELEEVRANVAKFGHIESCQFVKGYFEESMKDFTRPITALYLDVDLVSSTRTCIKSLCRQVVPGGYVFSQDGHLCRVLNLLNSEGFWHDEVGCEKPAIHGMGKSQLIWMRKPSVHKNDPTK